MGGRAVNNDRFRELDQVFSDILAGTSQAGRMRTSRKVGQALRRSQQQRIKSQKNPDGAPYSSRRRRFCVLSRASYLSGRVKCAA